MSTELLREVVARLTRLLEGLEDGDIALAEGIADDLVAELSRHLGAAERQEREAAR